jgi:hypothetical protein
LSVFFKGGQWRENLPRSEMQPAQACLLKTFTHTLVHFSRLVRFSEGAPGPSRGPISGCMTDQRAEEAPPSAQTQEFLLWKARRPPALPDWPPRPISSCHQRPPRPSTCWGEDLPFSMQCPSGASRASGTQRRKTAMPWQARGEPPCMPPETAFAATFWVVLFGTEDVKSGQ